MNNLTQHGRHVRALLLVGLAALHTGCVAVRYDVAHITDRTQINADPQVAAFFAKRTALTDQLVELSPNVDRNEAERVAEVALTYPMELAQQYKLTKPAITHNMLVNMGARPRGLCIDWTEDLLQRLHDLNLTTLRFYWGVAYPTNMFRLEHSSPVVAAYDDAFERGILLDAWRDSGDLYFGPVKQDERYAWERLYNFITDPPPEKIAAH